MSTAAKIQVTQQHGPRTLRVRAYDSGCGDAFLVSLLEDSREVVNMVVDFGVCWRCSDRTKKRRLIYVGRDLRKHARLKLVVISHPDWDHISGLCPRLTGVIKSRRPLGDMVCETWLPIQCHATFGRYFEAKAEHVRDFVGIVADMDRALAQKPRMWTEEMLKDLRDRIDDLTRRIEVPSPRPVRDETECIAELRQLDLGSLHGVFSLSSGTDLSNSLRTEYGLEMDVLAPLPTEQFIVDSLQSLTTLPMLKLVGVTDETLTQLEIRARALGLGEWLKGTGLELEYVRQLESYSEALTLLAGSMADYNVKAHIDEIRRIGSSAGTDLEPIASKLWESLGRNRDRLREFLTFGIRNSIITHTMVDTSLAFLSAAVMTVRNPLIHAGNGASIVIMISWNGVRLLFTGDATTAEWRAINELDSYTNILSDVHFFKIPHHGSSNGEPPDSVLDKILPKQTSGGRRPQAVITSCCNPCGPRRAACQSPTVPDVDYVAERAVLHWTGSSCLYNDFLF